MDEKKKSRKKKSDGGDESESVVSVSPRSPNLGKSSPAKRSLGARALSSGGSEITETPSRKEKRKSGGGGNVAETNTTTKKERKSGGASDLPSPKGKPGDGKRESRKSAGIPSAKSGGDVPALKAIPTTTSDSADAGIGSVGKGIGIFKSGKLGSKRKQPKRKPTQRVMKITPGQQAQPSPDLFLGDEIEGFVESDGEDEGDTENWEQEFIGGPGSAEEMMKKLQLFTGTTKPSTSQSAPATTQSIKDQFEKSTPRSAKLKERTTTGKEKEKERNEPSPRTNLAPITSTYTSSKLEEISGSWGDSWGDNELDLDLDETIKKNLLQEISDKILAKLAIFSPNLSSDELKATHAFLIEHFDTYEQQRTKLLSEHGVLPVLDMLARFKKDTNGLSNAIDIVNKFIEGDISVKEAFANMGGIPWVIRFADEKFADVPNVHLQVTIFIVQMVADSPLLKTFISSAGIPAIGNLLPYITSSSGFLSTNTISEEKKKIILMIVECIDIILNTETKDIDIPKNDFCRLWIHSELVIRLLKVISNRSLRDLSPIFLQKVANFFFTFSKADTVVKKGFTVEILKGLIENLPDVPSEVQLTIIKTLKNLTMEDSILSNFILVSNCMEVFVGLLNTKLTPSLCHYLLNTVYNICTFGKTKSREAAANAGIIPILKRMVEDAVKKKEITDTQSSKKKNSPKEPLEFAVPLLFEYARIPSVYPILLKNNIIQLYLIIIKLGYPYSYQSVDALAAWLVNDKKSVGEIVSQPEKCRQLSDLFSHADQETFEKLTESLLTIVQSSKITSNGLSNNIEFMNSIMSKLLYPKALVQVNLIKMLTSIYNNNKKLSGIVPLPSIIKALEELETNSPSLLVKDLAKNLKAIVKKDFERS